MLTHNFYKQSTSIDERIERIRKNTDNYGSQPRSNLKSADRSSSTSSEFSKRLNTHHSYASISQKSKESYGKFFKSRRHRQLGTNTQISSEKKPSANLGILAKKYDQQENVNHLNRK